MPTKLVIEEDNAYGSGPKITQVTNVLDISQETEVDPLDVYMKLSSRSYFNLGLLPVVGNGLLSVRQDMDDLQFVYQYQPGIYPVAWTQDEGGRPDVLQLAQPYRIVILDFINGNFYGARHFFSPRPITNLDQPLYHIPLPNLNCSGYHGTSVGWICLYQHDDTTHMSLGEKLIYGLKRASGEETYNDTNMGSTDGQNFYNRYSSYAFLCSSEGWASKSLMNGYEWTTDEKYWLPVMVAGPDNQYEHSFSPEAQPLTLRWAMYGHYSAYYTDNPDHQHGASVPRSRIMNTIDRAQSTYSVAKKFVGAVVRANTLPSYGSSPTQTLDPTDSGSVSLVFDENAVMVYRRECKSCKLVFESTEAHVDGVSMYKLEDTERVTEMYRFRDKENTGEHYYCANHKDHAPLCAYCEEYMGEADFDECFSMPMELQNYSDKLRNKYVCNECWYINRSVVVNCSAGCCHIGTLRVDGVPTSVIERWEAMAPGVSDLLISREDANAYLCRECAAMDYACDRCDRRVDEVCYISEDKIAILGLSDLYAKPIELCASCFVNYSLCECGNLVGNRWSTGHTSTCVKKPKIKDF